jgi:hypothetical protein
MRDVVVLTFEVVWLLALVLAVVIGLLTRHPGGRRLLRRWVRFPTFVWCEAERTVAWPVLATAIREEFARLHGVLPRWEWSFLPRFFVVRIVADARDDPTGTAVTVRAATLLQTKTIEEAADRLTAAFGRTGGDGQAPNEAGPAT